MSELGKIITEYLAIFIVSTVRVCLVCCTRVFELEAKTYLKIKLIRVPFTVHLLHDVLIIIIPERPAQFVIIHIGLALPFAPASCHLIRINQFKFAISSLPEDASRVACVGEQLQQKLPQLYLARAGARESLLAGSGRLHGIRSEQAV